MKTVAPIAFAIAAASFGPAAPAEACGGLLSVDGAVTQNAQLALFSVGATETDVIAVIDVPNARNGYGVLLPVPAGAIIDSEPVPAEDMAALEQRTRPELAIDYSGGGCGCASDDAGGLREDDGSSLVVGEKVQVGPVVAVTLSGDGDDIATWLTENGFLLPEGGQDVLDVYAGSGRSFIAFQRSADAGPEDTSVGVHITVPGQAYGYPLLIAQLGTDTELGVSVLIVADRGVSPDGIYEGIKISDLDRLEWEDSGYAAAVRTAVADAGGKAFIIEGLYAWDGANLTADGATVTVPDSLHTYFPDGSKLTRVSTLLQAEELTADATFDGPEVEVSPVQTAEGAGLFVDLSLLVLLVTAAGFALRRARARARAKRNPGVESGSGRPWWTFRRRRQPRAHWAQRGEKRDHRAA